MNQEKLTRPKRKNPIPEPLQGQIYMDPKYDTAFKELFDSKEAIKDFLDGVLELEGDEKIKNLTFSFDKTISMYSVQSKKVILDIFATTGSGRFLDIEMQKAEHDYLIDRAVLYKAFLIIKGKKEMDRSEEFLSLPKEARKSKLYELPETISIWICDFDLPGSAGEYVDEWALYNRNALKSGSLTPIFNKNRYIMISLPNFKKSGSEVKGPMDAWLYLLNHAGDGKELPRFGNEVLGSALERIRIENLNDELLTRQAKDMITQAEIDTRIAGGILRARAQALAEGRAEGLEKGLAEGREKGLAEGLAKGLAEGREQGLAEGIAEGREKGRAQSLTDVLDILQGMNLSPEQISTVKAKLEVRSK